MNHDIGHDAGSILVGLATAGATAKGHIDSLLLYDAIYCDKPILH